MASHYSERFGSQSQILQNLNNILTPIAQAGPDQQGMGPQELAALRTQATEGVGANYEKATRSLQNVLAARGGGREFLPTGAGAELQETLASEAARESSQAELGITRANYELGRQKWQQATAGLSSLGSQYDPTAFGSGAQKGFESSFGMADKISQEQNQATAGIIGGITSLGMDAATFGAGALGGGGFDFAGGLQALTGKG
jgi:hypothetical protein